MAHCNTHSDASSITHGSVGQLLTSLDGCQVSGTRPTSPIGRLPQPNFLNSGPLWACQGPVKIDGALQRPFRRLLHHPWQCWAAFDIFGWLSGLWNPPNQFNSASATATFSQFLASHSVPAPRKNRWRIATPIQRHPPSPMAVLGSF